MIDKEELKFKFRERKNEIQIMLKYFFMEPFIEGKRLISGYYNSTLFFWISVATLIVLWRDKVGGYKMKIAIFLVIFSYIYMFFKSGRWKEYYQKEMVEGKKIE